MTFRTSKVKLHGSILLITSRKTLKNYEKCAHLSALKKGLKYAHNTRDKKLKKLNMRLNSISFYTTTTHQNQNEKRKQNRELKKVKSTRYLFYVSLVK